MVEFTKDLYLLLLNDVYITLLNSNFHIHYHIYTIFPYLELDIVICSFLLFDSISDELKTTVLKVDRLLAKLSAQLKCVKKNVITLILIAVFHLYL